MFVGEGLKHPHLGVHSRHFKNMGKDVLIPLFYQVTIPLKENDTGVLDLES